MRDERTALKLQVVGVLRRIEPVVHAPIQAVRVVLGVPFEPAVIGTNELLLVGDQVSVRIAGEPEIRWFSDEDASVEHLQRPREDQFVEKRRPAIHPAIVIVIFQDGDASNPLA